MEQFKVGRVLGISTSSNLTKAKSSLNEIRLLRALGSWVLKTCKDRVFRNSGPLSHCLTVLVVKKTVPNIQPEYCLSFFHHMRTLALVSWGHHRKSFAQYLPAVLWGAMKPFYLAPCKGMGHMIPAWFRTAVISLPCIHGAVTDWMQKEIVGRPVSFKQSWNCLKICKSNQISFTVVILWTGEYFLQCWEWKQQLPELPPLLSRKVSIWPLKHRCLELFWCVLSG